MYKLTYRINYASFTTKSLRIKIYAGLAHVVVALRLRVGNRNVNMDMNIMYKGCVHVCVI